MIYYDLDDFHAFDTKTNSFKTTLSRTKNKAISTDNISSYKNFNDLIKKMYDLRINPNTERKDVLKLQNSLKEHNKFTNKNWLIKRVNELFDKY